MRRDPYGSRGSKYEYIIHQLYINCVEILMDLVDLNKIYTNADSLLSMVEILMDLVDLNSKPQQGSQYLILVEILMDLVDLNCTYAFLKMKSICRDPYGSRGSKFNTQNEIILDKSSRTLWISWI